MVQKSRRSSSRGSGQQRSTTVRVVAGVLALNGADVLGASAHSEHGRALSVFRVGSVLGGEPDWARIDEQVNRALAGRLAVAVRLAAPPAVCLRALLVVPLALPFP